MSQHECTETCGPGEKCSEDICVPCDDGSYQDADQHKNKSCKLWSKKPSGEHWVLDKNGTKKTDNKYRCADGYDAKEYMNNSWDCFKSEDVSTVTPTINTTVPVLNNSSFSSTEATQNVRQADKSTPLSVLVPSITTGVFLVLAVVIVLIIFRRKKKLCFRKTKAQTTDAHSEAEMGALVNGKSSQSRANGHAHKADDVDGTHRTHHADGRNDVDGASHLSRPYEQFISEISLPYMDRFLQLLENPDEQFNIQRSLNEHNDPNNSLETYRLVFLDWLNLYKNNPKHVEWVKSGLEEIGRPNAYTSFQSANKSSLD